MSVSHTKFNQLAAVPLLRRLIAGAILANLFVYILGGLSLYQSRAHLEKRNEITTQNLAQVFEDNIAGTIDKISLILLTIKDETEEQLALGTLIFCRALILRWQSEKQVTVELRQSNKELESLNRELESFCYSISHELRAPIARLTGFSQLIGEYLDHGQQQSATHVAQRISVASERLRSVVDSLLMMNRLSRAELQLAPVNLSAISQIIVNHLREETGERSVMVSIEPEIMVTGDQGMLTLCMENLLQNAFKYTGKNKITEIEVGCVSSSGERAVFVRDNGAGFDSSFANKLFEPFCRLHTEDEFTGNGIGLAVVQRIIEKHGGRIWAISAPEHGATFYFTVAAAGS